MKVIYGIGKVENLIKDAVVVIGVFDGLHMGHRALIEGAVQKARELRSPAVVLTFDPHPVHVLYPDANLRLITSLPHRVKLIEKLGVAVCVVVKFTKQFSHLSPESFVKRYLAGKIRAKEIFVGDDFRFGEHRSGTISLFRQLGERYGFQVNALSPVGGKKKKPSSGCDKNISSTVIRDAIASGDLKSAEKFLGRPVSVMGEVLKGDGRGKLLGFPTANIYPQNELLPPFGAYAVRVEIGRRFYNGMANIGVRPSFRSQNPAANVEVNIFDFNKDIYGETITVEFAKKLRDEKLFKSREALISQLEKDEKKARACLEA